jgi:hypothetical protein
MLAMLALTIACTLAGQACAQQMASMPGRAGDQAPQDNTSVLPDDMKRRHSTDSLFSKVRSWSDAIPLGPLDPLQQASGPSRVSHEDPGDAALIPLPVSRKSSLQDAAPEPSWRTQGSKHSSLSTLEQSLESDKAEALHVPLPDSNGSENDHCSNGDVSTVDSLFQLQAACLFVGDEQSTPSSTRQHSPGNNRPSTQMTGTPVSSEGSSSSSAVRNYWENIRPLTRLLPHLKAIQPPNGRHERVGWLKAIDYLHDGTAAQVRCWKFGPESDPQELVTSLQGLKRVHDDAIASRMIIVEDLCSEVTAALGSVFKLDPEFFAEHLNRSGYNGADYGDPPPTRWKTAHLPKNYASMTWRRPVYHSAKVAELLQTPSAIVDKRSEASKAKTSRPKSAATWRDAEFDPSGKRNMQAVEHDPVVDTNIFRQSWPLSSSSVPRAAYQGAEDEVHPGTTAQSATSQKESDLLIAAWEERVSFCYYRKDTRTPIGKCARSRDPGLLVTKKSR